MTDTSNGYLATFRLDKVPGTMRSEERSSAIGVGWSSRKRRQKVVVEDGWAVLTETRNSTGRNQKACAAEDMGEPNPLGAGRGAPGADRRGRPA